MDYYSNFQRYNFKGDRLSIFGEVDGDSMKVSVFRCSRRDQFDRKASIEAFKLHREGKVPMVRVNRKDTVMHPEDFVIKIEDGRPKVSFLKWCSLHYYRIINQSLRYAGSAIGNMRFECPRLDRRGAWILVKTLVR